MRPEAARSAGREWAAEETRRLYRRAFAEFGIQCLWSRSSVPDPTPAHARVIARTLKIEGGRAAWELAWEIEAACDAAERGEADESA